MPDLPSCEPSFATSCTVCGAAPPVGLTVVESRSVCADCLRGLSRCGFCRTPGFTFAPAAGLAQLCPQCLNRVHPCGACAMPSLTTRRSAEGTPICLGCLDTYEVCVGCSLPTRDGRYVAGGHRACGRCADSMPACGSCARLLPEHRNCDQCGHGPKVWGYYYRPDPIFHSDNDDPLHLGLELELIVPSHRYDQAVQATCDGLGALGYLKQDSSISPCGFEIVTHPMSYQYALQRFPWHLLGELAELGCRTNSSVGLHVHASRAAFTGSPHVFRWLKFIYRNEAAVTRLSRRTSRYAVFDPETRRNTTHLAKGPHYAVDIGRRQAVNTKPRHTLELRTFAATLDTQSVQAALGFVDASIRYTAELTVPDIHAGAWDWNRFTGWAQRQLQYRPLTGELQYLAADREAQEVLACAC